ncbi:MAG: putative Fe-S cluster assembly protein SufT [Puniceicoccaceae bacterium]|nr:MAG: putative Fe-S cluster assembly protein SufT [Puniceicoccaceae bacterium]
MNAVSDHTLTRDCDAIAIPGGESVSLPAGSRVSVTQTLGGSFTVITDFGLARIAGQDADALGLEPPEESAAPPAAAGEGPPTPEAVWDQLRTVYDPEIPVNIVDLGLVYSLDIQPTDTGGHKVEVQMTLTAPGCGMGPAIAADAKSKILVIPGVTEAEVHLVWDPPWNQNMISEEGKMKLGLI